MKKHVRPAAARRATAVYTGRVQGVGFRYTTVRLAGAHEGLTGYVMNQYDGTVLLVAEGEEDAIRAFLRDIRQSGLGRYITDVQVDWGPATGAFERFGVRYG